MRFPLASMIVVVAALTAAACILPDQMKQLEQDVAQMRRELTDVRQDQTNALDVRAWTLLMTPTRPSGETTGAKRVTPRFLPAVRTTAYSSNGDGWCRTSAET